MTDATGGQDADGLIQQLQARAADPERRTELRPSIFESGLGAVSLGGMVSLGRSLADSLRRVVDSNRAGRMPDPDVMRTAEGLQHQMTTPAPAAAGSLRRATAEDVRAAERSLGLAFPALLARLYLEVGDGGFGPGSGLLSLERLVREGLDLRRGEMLPRNRTWPTTLVPLVERDPGWLCLDVERGAIVEWDPEDLEERSSEARFRASFSGVSPSLQAWLENWLRRMAAAERKPSQEERWARMAARAQSPEGQARQQARTRRYLEQLSPEDRKKWGFDELYPDLGAEETSKDS